MKTDKITRVLLLYHQLLHGHRISKALFCIEHGIHERSFDRDVEDIRLFLSEIYAHSEVLYDKSKNEYYLSDRCLAEMDAPEAAVLGKLLLHSGAFRADETEGLLSDLCAAVSERGRAELRTRLRQDCLQYQPAHDGAILKTVFDLERCIENRRRLRLTFLQEDGSKAQAELAPMELRFEIPWLYLYAYELSSRNRIKRFRADRIVEFQVQDERYPHSLKQTYQINQKERKTHEEDQISPDDGKRNAGTEHGGAEGQF